MLFYLINIQLRMNILLRTVRISSVFPEITLFYKKNLKYLCQNLSVDRFLGDATLNQFLLFKQLPKFK